MPNDLSLFFIKYFSIGGLLVSVLAGTGLAAEPRRWWTVALLITPVAAIVNSWLLFPGCGPTELSACAGAFVWHLSSALAVAAAGRIGYRFRWPGFVRVLVCLVTDFAVRWGTAIAVIVMACTIDAQNCDL